MTFPVYFHLAGLHIPAHPVFEILGYTVGFQIYLRLRAKYAEAAAPFEQMAWVIVGAAAGAPVGSKLLAWVENPIEYWASRGDWRAVMSAKTIAGGLIGGWIGVEIAKRCVGIRESTGDLFVLPLAVGTAIGRVGCFLTGLPDHTYGIHSSLPWAADFGDGPRHPTQLYESLFVLAWGMAVWFGRRRVARGNERAIGSGRLFLLYLGGYMAFRVLVEFLKPTYRPYMGLSAIQVASAGTVGVCAMLGRRVRAGDGPSILRGSPEDPRG